MSDFLKELAAIFKTFAILATLANTVFASSLAEPSARCEVIEIALLSNHNYCPSKCILSVFQMINVDVTTVRKVRTMIAVLVILVISLRFQVDQFQCNNRLCIPLDYRWIIYIIYLDSYISISKGVT